jgi:hypothetical protein
MSFEQVERLLKAVPHDIEGSGPEMFEIRVLDRGLTIYFESWKVVAVKRRPDR